MPASGSRLVVYAALVGNVLIAAAKFVAAALTGSSAMWSEGVHSLVDGTEDALLLYGLHRAALPPDPAHPFGHGRELYFWSFIVALVALALGAGATCFEGILRLRSPAPIHAGGINYAVLGLAALFDGTSWLLAVREFRARKGSLGYASAVHRSKDPSTFSVLLEDSAALLGVLIAFLGLLGEQVFDAAWLDGAASIGIGVVMAASAAILARETSELLIGEPAHPRVREGILRIAAATPGVRNANGVLTVQLGPDQVVATLSAEFEDGLTTPQIEDAIRHIEDEAKRERGEIVALFVKPQTASTWSRRRARLERAAG